MPTPGDWYGRKAPPADRLALVRLAIGRIAGGWLTDRPSMGVAGPPPVQRSPVWETLGALAALAVLVGLALWVGL